VKERGRRSGSGAGEEPAPRSHSDLQIYHQEDDFIAHTAGVDEKWKATMATVELLNDAK
jgi:hypothetical protein